MANKQQEAFWSTIQILDKATALPYVMVIGSWAEYLYTFYFKTEYVPNIRTRDVDFLYPNIRKPSSPVKLEQMMKEAGFTVTRDTLTEVVKMFKEDLLEIEFLTRQVGAGKNLFTDIHGIGIRGQSIRDVNILSDYPLLISANGYNINVPEPSVYILQKIIINPHRMPPNKRAKDIEAIRNILPHIQQSERDLKVFEQIMNNCTPKEYRIIASVCKEHTLELPFRI